mgnify:CR=1 FL=1
MDTEAVTVVSGLPRSGTSMLMKILEEGGLPPLTDNKREADVDNPKGYYEFDRVLKLPDDVTWLPEARGKAVKVLAILVKHLPPGYRYRVIFIQRNMDEMLASQKKMLVRRGEDPDRISDSEMRDLFNKTVKDLKNNLALRNDISVLYVSYNDIMKNPQPHIDAIDKFMGGWMDKDKMKAVVDARLYRNRAQ